MIEEGDYSILKSIIIESVNVSTYICLVKEAGERINNGVEQRDAAIKMNGLGATCLIFDGYNLVFPKQSQMSSTQNGVKISKKIMKYLKIKMVNVNLQFQKNDVIIIGLGDNPYKARLAAFNAALTLI